MRWRIAPTGSNAHCCRQHWPLLPVAFGMVARALPPAALLYKDFNFCHRFIFYSYT
jgi:hypothetical protein